MFLGWCFGFDEDEAGVLSYFSRAFFVCNIQAEGGTTVQTSNKTENMVVTLFLIRICCSAGNTIVSPKPLLTFRHHDVPTESEIEIKRNEFMKGLSVPKRKSMGNTAGPGNYFCIYILYSIAEAFAFRWGLRFSLRIARLEALPRHGTARTVSSQRVKGPESAEECTWGIKIIGTDQLCSSSCVLRWAECEEDENEIALWTQDSSR
jgi:hypothetical protein